MAFVLNVNGAQYVVENAEPETPLLWVLRDSLGFTGTKYGCGISECGMCTVQVDGQAVRSCSVNAATAIGKSIRTIESLSRDGTHPVQLAWKEFDVPQCGYCQSAMIMTTVALLENRPNPSDAEIDAAVNVSCRCGTYHRVRQAIHRAAELMTV